MATRSLARSCTHICAPTSAARAFLQLAPRRHHSNAPLQVLDFLIPSIPSTSIRNGTASRASSCTVRSPGRRTFTASTRRRITAIVNPKKDEDGLDMNVEITPRASNRLKEIMLKDSNPNLALRIQVESGGCHGFQYLMSLTTLPSLDAMLDSISGQSAAPSTASSDTVEAVSSKGEGTKAAKLDEDDTVFAADDGSGAKVVMDGPSLELLKGSKVDFTMELIGSQFKIVDNPLATSSCGCGTSFDIKA